MSLAVASVAGCCCNQVEPCVGCNAAGYANPPTAVGVLLTSQIAGQAGPASLGFTAQYAPLVTPFHTLCRWIDPEFKSVDSPSSNGQYVVRLIMRGISCVVTASGSTVFGYVLTPADTNGFNGWHLIPNDGGVISTIAMGLPWASKNLCTPAPFGEYGAISPPNTRHGIVS